MAVVDRAVRLFRARNVDAIERLRRFIEGQPRTRLNPQLAERAREHVLALLPERFEREPDEIFEAEREALTPEDLIAATTHAAELAWHLLEEVGHEDAELYQAAATLREDAALFAQGARRCTRCQRVLALAEFGEAPGAPDGSFRKRRCDTCERLDTRWSGEHG